jgi:hypothetical protein
MAATNKCLAQSNKSPHRANATKKRKARDSRQPRTTTMTTKRIVQGLTDGLGLLMVFFLGFAMNVGLSNTTSPN